MVTSQGSSGSDRVFLSAPACTLAALCPVKNVHRIVVSAEGSRDLACAKLTWRWGSLRGDADRIASRKLNDEGSIA